jgi:hypothetical protein
MIDMIFWWTGAIFFTWYMTGIVVAVAIVLFSIVSKTCVSICKFGNHFGTRYTYPGFVQVDDHSIMCETRSILASHGSC